MGNETGIFALLTVMLFVLGFIMPFVNEVATGEVIINEIDGLSNVESNDDEGLSFGDFASSMLKAFFWVYGELSAFGNLIKVMINFIWAYLLIRLFRGGG